MCLCGFTGVTGFHRQLLSVLASCCQNIPILFHLVHGRGVMSGFRPQWRQDLAGFIRGWGLVPDPWSFIPRWVIRSVMRRLVRHSTEPSKVWPSIPTWINESLAVLLWKFPRQEYNMSPEKKEESVNRQTKKATNLRTTSNKRRMETQVFSKKSNKKTKNLKISQNISWNNLWYFLITWFCETRFSIANFNARKRNLKQSQTILKIFNNHEKSQTR